MNTNGSKWSFKNEKWAKRRTNWKQTERKKKLINRSSSFSMYQQKKRAEHTTIRFSGSHVFQSDTMRVTRARVKKILIVIVHKPRRKLYYIYRCCEMKFTYYTFYKYNMISCGCWWWWWCCLIPIHNPHTYFMSIIFVCFVSIIYFCIQVAYCLILFYRLWLVSFVLSFAMAALFVVFSICVEIFFHYRQTVDLNAIFCPLLFWNFIASHWLEWRPDKKNLGTYALRISYLRRLQKCDRLFFPSSYKNVYRHRCASIFRYFDRINRASHSLQRDAVGDLKKKTYTTAIYYELGELEDETRKSRTFNKGTEQNKAKIQSMIFLVSPILSLWMQLWIILKHFKCSWLHAKSYLTDW